MSRVPGGVVIGGRDPILGLALRRAGLKVGAEVAQAELLFPAIEEQQPALLILTAGLDGAYDLEAMATNLEWLFPQLPVFVAGVNGVSGGRLPAGWLRFPVPVDYRRLAEAARELLAGEGPDGHQAVPNPPPLRREFTPEMGPPRGWQTAPTRTQEVWPSEERPPVMWPASRTAAPQVGWEPGAVPRPQATPVGMPRAGWQPGPGVSHPLAQGVSRPLPQVVTVCSPKGGVGKTLLAVNLASALARRTGMEVLLLDWDLASADVSVHLDLRSGPTLLDLINSGQEIDKDLLRAHVVRHRGSGCFVLRGPARPELAEFVTQEHLRSVLISARAAFSLVIVDTAPSPCDEALCQALESAHRIVLVVVQDAACLYQARVFLDLMPRLGVHPEAVWVVVNRYHEGIPDLKEITSFLGVKPTAVLPDEWSLACRAITEGTPLVTQRNPGRLGEAMLELTERIWPTPGIALEDRRGRSLWPWRKRPERASR